MLHTGGMWARFAVWCGQQTTAGSTPRGLTGLCMSGGHASSRVLSRCRICEASYDNTLHRRRREFVTKGVAYTAIAIRTDGSSIFVAGSDQRIKVWLIIWCTSATAVTGADGWSFGAGGGRGRGHGRGHHHRPCPAHRCAATGCKVETNVPATGGQTLLAATDRGTLRCYRLPLTAAFSEVCGAVCGAMSAKFISTTASCVGGAHPSHGAESRLQPAVCGR